MFKKRDWPIFATGLLVVSYSAGLSGWLWDWQAHLSAADTTIAHLVMNGSSIVILVVLASLAPVFAGREGYLLTYSGLLIGLALLIVSSMRDQPIGVVIGSLLLLRSAWLEWRNNRRAVLAVAGIAIILVGIVVDAFWHEAFPEPVGGEAGPNMLLQPGHLMTLVGWVLGFVGAVVLVLGWGSLLAIALALLSIAFRRRLLLGFHE